MATEEIQSPQDIQSVAYAASITPNADAGEVVFVGVLTGAITVNNPTGSLMAGNRLIFHFQQDATGGRVVSWGSAFKVNWTPTTTANLRNVIAFLCDGQGNWIQLFSAVGLLA